MNRRDSKIKRLFFIFILLVITAGLICYLIFFNEKFCRHLWKFNENRSKAESTISLDTLYQNLFEPVIEPDSPWGPSPQKPWIAIIIDDFGPPWSAKDVQGFYELPYDLTLSIIPGNLGTVKAAQATQAKGKECFIHLPMEPLDASTTGYERDMIYTSMTAEQIRTIFNRAVKEIPSAVGVNNHMGSKATTDWEVMTILAAELKQRNLVFVDSRTAPGSCGFKCMREQQVPALGRDVFLDYIYTESQIKEQLDHLVKTAQRRGWAVGLGHVRAKTLKVLQQELPRIVNEGVRIVSAGYLIETIYKGKRQSTQDTP